MSELVEIENRATLARVTCGWPHSHLSFDFVRPYWRDAHSPAIARRDGIYEYRHYPLDHIRGDLFAAFEGIDVHGKPNEQLRWLSDVRYADEAGMDAFGADPSPSIRAQILADIEMIVDKSTTYKVIGPNARTLIDNSGDPAPLGPTRSPTFQVFFRRRSAESEFRRFVSALASQWAETPGVVRVRLNLFETPDMEAERAAGYPVKTHPAEMQYQAWIDLVVDHEAVIARLVPEDVGALTRHLTALHAYPSPAAYTFNYKGKPTLAGLRGFSACEAIRNMKADHQKNPALLEWMYGDVARGGCWA